MVAAALDQALVQLLVFLALVADQVAADQAMAEDLLEIKAVMEDQADQEPIKVVAVAVAQVPMVGMDKVLHQTMQDLVAPVLPGMIVLLVLGAAAAVDIRYLLLQHPTLDLEVPAAVEMAPAPGQIALGRGEPGPAVAGRATLRFSISAGGREYIVLVDPTLPNPFSLLIPLDREDSQVTLELARLPGMPLDIAFDSGDFVRRFTCVRVE